MKPFFTNLRESFSRAMLVSGSAIVVILCLEMGLRAFSPPIGLSYEWLLKDRKFVSDPDYIYTSKDIPLVLGVSGKRIAIVGDSHSDCTVWDFPCYPQLLLDTLRNDGIPARIEDYALSGRNTDEEYRILTDRVFPSKPDLIVWQMYVNDVRENLLFPMYSVSSDGRLTPLDVKDSWAYRRQRFYGSVPGSDILRNTWVFRFILRVFERDLAARIYGPHEKSRLAASLARISLEVRDVVSRSERDGIPVTFVLIPPQSLQFPGQQQILSDQSAYNNEMWGELDRILTAVPGYVRIGPPGNLPISMDVLGAASQSGEQADGYYLDREDVSQSGDKHLNVRGNRLVAEMLADRIHSLMDREGVKESSR